MNIAPECGAVKAPHTPLTWKISDQRSALDLHCIAKHYRCGLYSLEQACHEIERLRDRRGVVPYTRHDRAYTLDDLAQLFHLTIDGIGGWN